MNSHIVINRKDGKLEIEVRYTEKASDSRKTGNV